MRTEIICYIKMLIWTHGLLHTEWTWSKKASKMFPTNGGEKISLQYS